MVEQGHGQVYEQSDISDVCRFGTEANLAEIHKNADKLAITIELNNFEKAEMFAANIKELVAGQSEELDKMLFKLILTIRKANYEKAVTILGTVKELLSGVTGEEFR